MTDTNNNDTKSIELKVFNDIYTCVFMLKEIINYTNLKGEKLKSKINLIIIMLSIILIINIGFLLIILN